MDGFDCNCCSVPTVSMFESVFEKYPFFRVIPAILVMAVIFKLSASTSSELSWVVLPWDKACHATEYAVLAFCYCLWWKKEDWTAKMKVRIGVVVLLTILYGCSDEFHQRFVEGRSSDVMDVVADTVGGIVGAGVYALIVKIKSRREK